MGFIIIFFLFISFTTHIQLNHEKFDRINVKHEILSNSKIDWYRKYNPKWFDIRIILEREIIVNICETIILPEISARMRSKLFEHLLKGRNCGMSLFCRLPHTYVTRVLNQQMCSVITLRFLYLSIYPSLVN